MRKLLLSFPVLALSACLQGAPPEPYTPEDVTLDASPERVWQALTIVYTDLDLPIENMDRSSWFLRSDEMRFPPSESTGEMFDCGSIATSTRVEYGAEELGVVASITTLLIPRDEGATRIRNRVNAETDSELGGTCYSTGVLEKRIVEALQEQLQ